MERSQVAELHYITPISNIPSILEHGILSHARVAAASHASIADEDVQDIRHGKSVPNGRPLHEYANLYFDARNPMMSRRRNLRGEIAVVRIHPAVMDLPGVVIADGNAASTATRFLAFPSGLIELDAGRVYATYWTDDNYWAYVEKKRQRCAEVLVPDVAPPDFIIGCFVYEEAGALLCQQLAPLLTVEVGRRVFFG